MRSVLPLTALIATLVVARASAAQAAPRKKQCIAAAEAGQQLRSSGKLGGARKAFGACTASVCPAVVRRDCGRWIDEIDAAMPSVSVKLEDEKGAEVPEGRVLVDGEPLLRGTEGHATPIDPGVHRFVWTREAGNVEEDLVVREGERNRVVVLRVPALPEPPAASVEKPEPLPPVTRSPIPWIVGGLGVVVAGAGAAFWGVGLNERSNLGVTCASAHACSQSDVDASKTKLVVGDVMIGVGIITIASAVVLLLNQSTAPSTTTASR